MHNTNTNLTDAWSALVEAVGEDNAWEITDDLVRRCFEDQASAFLNDASGEDRLRLIIDHEYSIEPYIESTLDDIDHKFVSFMRGGVTIIAPDGHVYYAQEAHRVQAWQRNNLPGLILDAFNERWEENIYGWDGWGMLREDFVKDFMNNKEGTDA